MAQFAPYQQQQPLPSYLGLSKEPGPIKPNISLGKAFEGIAEIFEQGVKGADELEKQYKEDISKEAGKAAEEITKRESDEVDRQLKEVGGPNQGLTPEESLPSGASPAQGGPPLQGSPLERTGDEPLRILPEDAQRTIDRVGRTVEGARQGKYYDTGRQMTGEAAKADLLARYGWKYKPEIDAAFAKYGMSPAAELAKKRSVLNEQLTRKSAEEGKVQTFENSRVVEIEQVWPGYFKIPLAQRTNEGVQNELRTRLAAQGSEKFRNDQERERMTFTKETEDFWKRNSDRLMTREMQLDLGVATTGLLGNLGIKDTGQGLSAGFTQFQENIRNIPPNQRPETLEAVGRKLADFEDAYVRKQIDKYRDMPIMGKDGKPTGETVLGFYGVKAIEDTARQQLAPITGQMKIAISKDGTAANFSLAESGVRAASSWKGTQERDIQRNYETLDRIGIMVKQVGPQLASEWLHKNKGEEKASKEFGAFIDGVTTTVGTGTKNPDTGQSYVFSDVAKDYSNRFKIMGDGNPMPPADAAALMERTYKNFMNPNSPPDKAKEFANFIFGDRRLLSMIKEGGGEKFSFLQKYASPEAGERVYSFNDPKLIRDYEDFITNGVVAVSGEITGNVNDVKSFQEFTSKAKGLMKLEYDPKTNRVVGNIPEGAELRRNESNPTTGIVLEAQALKAKDTVDRLNANLALLEPVFSRGGPSRVPPALLSTLMRMGINVKVPDELMKDMTGESKTTTADGKKTETTQSQWDTLMKDPLKAHEFNGISFTGEQFRSFLAMRDQGVAIAPVSDGVSTPAAAASTSSTPVSPAPDARAELDFQRGIRATEWFKEFVKQYGEEPDLNTKDYDYRRAWAEGARPNVRDKGDNQLHWPSKYKGDDHPHRIIDGIDTRTGKPVDLKDKTGQTIDEFQYGDRLQVGPNSGKPITPTSAEKASFNTGQAYAGGLDYRQDPAIYQKTGYASPIKVATQFKGLNEEEHRSVISDFISKAAGKKVDPATTAWCAGFVNAVLYETGRDGTNSLMARSFLQYGTPTNKPTEGDIVVFSRGRGNTYGHVGFFKGYDEAGKILVLGGNQGGEVNITPYPTSRLLGFRKVPEAGSKMAGVDWE